MATRIHGMGDVDALFVVAHPDPLSSGLDELKSSVPPCAGLFMRRRQFIAISCNGDECACGELITNSDTFRSTGGLETLPRSRL
jgi:hypothetical protein